MSSVVHAKSFRLTAWRNAPNRVTTFPFVGCLSQEGTCCNQALRKMSLRSLASAGPRSTGLKLFGKGEWDGEKHDRARRSWRKLHFAIDTGTGEIVASVLTSKEAEDTGQVALVQRGEKIRLTPSRSPLSGPRRPIPSWPASDASANQLLTQTSRLNDAFT